MKNKLDSKSIGIAIRKRRENCEIQQNELAEWSGISASYLCRIEKGLKEPSASTLMAIAKVLRCSVDDLLRAG